MLVTRRGTRGHESLSLPGHVKAEPGCGSIVPGSLKQYPAQVFWQIPDPYLNIRKDSKGLWLSEKWGAGIFPSSFRIKEKLEIKNNRNIHRFKSYQIILHNGLGTSRGWTVSHIVAPWMKYLALNIFLTFFFSPKAHNLRKTLVTAHPGLKCKLYINVHKSIIHNSQKMEISVQGSIDRQME